MMTICYVGLRNIFEFMYYLEGYFFACKPKSMLKFIISDHRGVRFLLDNFLNQVFKSLVLSESQKYRLSVRALDVT